MKSEYNEYRHKELKSLVKGVFVTTKNSYQKNDANTAIIYRGEGQDLKDCSFQAVDRERYYNLFEIALTYKNCRFEYKGNRDNQSNFDQTTAMDNAVDFFVKRNIPLDYTFQSKEEKALFSRLIFRFVIQLLDVLFEEYLPDIEGKYQEVLNQIRCEVIVKDIYELIYETAKWSDAEMITYGKRTVDECDSVILIDFGYESSKYLTDDIDTCLKLRPIDKSIIYTRSEIENDFYEIEAVNYKKIHYLKNINYYPVEIFDLVDEQKLVYKYKRYNKDRCVPRFLCVAFCLNDVIVLPAYKKTDIKRNICNKLAERAYAYIYEEYIDSKKQSINRCNQIGAILNELMSIDYRLFFGSNEYLPSAFKLGFVRFEQFLKNQSIELSDKNVVFKYLITVWIDEFSYILDSMLTDDNYRDNIKGTTLNKYLRAAKAQEKTNNIKEANELFCDYYKNNKKVIEDFVRKFDVVKKELYDNQFEECLQNGSSPYEHLRYALSLYKTYLQNPNTK